MKVGKKSTLPLNEKELKDLVRRFRAFQAKLPPKERRVLQRAGKAQLSDVKLFGDAATRKEFEKIFKAQTRFSSSDSATASIVSPITLTLRYMC